MRVSSLLAFACIVFLLSSCRTQRAITNYIEDMTDTTAKRNFYITEPLIQKNDQLSIQVSSVALDDKIDLLFNQQTNNINYQPGLYGYLVDQKGNLELPRIGTIHAEGLTKEQLANEIKNRLKDQLTDPTVVIRFTNFRIIVIGEVASPGVKTVSVENLTILEALAMAGDITQFGQKKQVKVLTARQIWNTEGFYEVNNEYDRTVTKALELLKPELPVDSVIQKK